jgi:membrane protein
MPEVMMVSSLVRKLLDLMPYLLMSAFFIGLYVTMPNTHVDWRCAIVPGIVAGTAMQWLQLFYVHSQIWVTGYNAIYGSFAALPLFMLWVQMSWTICLFGAELTFTNQQMKRLGINLEEPDFHPMVEVEENGCGENAVKAYSDGIDGL